MPEPRQAVPRLLACSDVTSEALDDELLLHNPRADTFHCLNESAAAIYALCDGTRTWAEVARAMAGRYPAVGGALERDVRSTIDELVAKGLVREMPG